MTAKKAYQILIELRGSQPKIWRRLLISPQMSLYDLHRTIQLAMDWDNSHMHHFIKNKKIYALRTPWDDYWEEMGCIDYSEMKVSDLLKRKGSRMLYEYDFGDSWYHDIIVEKTNVESTHKTLPVCLEGENNSPPEDCGGIWSYMNILEILKDPEHEEYDEWVEWMSEDFDPTYFDKDKLNKRLALLSEDDE